MASHPQNVQGSDADRAEGGLDVENAFAEVDEQTAVRMSREAQAHQEQQQQAGFGHGANRVGGGRSAVDMLTSHVADGLERSEEFTYEGPEG